MRQIGVLTAIVVCCSTGLFAQSQDWQSLTGAEIETALNDKTLIYEASKQVFYTTGRTLYDNGRPSWGYWAVRGDQYCSQWPPADGWACYDMERHADGSHLKFVSETGYGTIGHYDD